MRFLEKIFSVKNSKDKKYKIITFFRFKIKFNQEKILYKRFNEHIIQMRAISEKLKPVTREDCFDRYYINDYVELNKEYIKGDVLEFAGGEVIYAKKYGSNPNVKIMTGLCHKDVVQADYYCDLDDSSTLPEQKFDCIIATQVITYMNNPRTALLNLKSMLKPNGVLILTVPGSLFHHSIGTHHMFSFTQDSLHYLMNEIFNGFNNFKLYEDMEYTQYMLHWMKKNPYQKPVSLEPIYTLIMGICAKNSVGGGGVVAAFL